MVNSKLQDCSPEGRKDYGHLESFQKGAMHHTLQALHQADAIIIAASNGFDISDGYNQFACDQEFLNVFGDFNREYGLTCILQGIAARWPDLRARWAFLARVLQYGFLSYTPSETMVALREFTANVPRFVVTCNCNGRFERAGFDADALLETEGAYTRLQCSQHCSNDLFDAPSLMSSLVSEAGAPLSRISVSGNLPKCPCCGAALDVAVDDRGGLVATQLFQRQLQNYRAFLNAYRKRRVVILELGVGQNNQAIKYPLMKYAEQCPNATYLVFNSDSAHLPAGMNNRAFAVSGNLKETLLRLYKEELA